MVVKWIFLLSFIHYLFLPLSSHMANRETLGSNVRMQLIKMPVSEEQTGI